MAPRWPQACALCLRLYACACDWLPVPCDCDWLPSDPDPDPAIASQRSLIELLGCFAGIIVAFLSRPISWTATDEKGHLTSCYQSATMD